jgi:hypothetical protein
MNEGAEIGVMYLSAKECQELSVIFRREERSKRIILQSIQKEGCSDTIVLDF